MPRGLKIHANERIDLADFEHGTRDFINERVELEAERGWLDSKGRVLDGFRIELADQTTSPGQFTIHNGNAFDRDGRRLTNEDEDNASRSATLSAASTTYYVEVEFVETDTDTDARAFWDPTYDNGSAIPYDGKEFSQNVATRVSYDWTIVSPISTSGFEISTNANSTRIPVAQLSTDATGQITLAANPGLSTVPVASVLEADAALGASAIRVHDARLFPDSGSVVVGVGLGTAETKAILTVDRRNGIITFTTAFLNDHDAGEIARMSGTGSMLLENTLPSSVSATTSTHPDKRRRFFQGDEFRGSALLTSKDSAGRDDLNMRNLKDYVDFLAAQLREMRWGTPDVGENSAAPPTTFTADARYYTNSGGIAGSRTATVTIGNGTTSWGDLNGTDEDVFVDAIAALPASGGTIFIKQGTYTIGTQVSVTKPVRFIGEGREVVTINKGAVAYAFDVTASSLTDLVEFSHITMGLDAAATSDQVLSLTLGTIVLSEAQFEGRVDALAVYVRARNTRFVNLSTLTLPNVAFTATGLLESSFVSCKFQTDGSDSSNTGISCASTIQAVTFDSCIVDAPIAVNMGGAACSGVFFHNCQLLGDSSAFLSTGTFDQGVFANCAITSSAASSSAATMSFATFTNSALQNCRVSTVPSGSTTLLANHLLFQTTGDVGGSSISGSVFRVLSGSGFVTGVYLDDPDATDSITISGCAFTTLTYGVYVDAPVADSVIHVSDCLFDGQDVADTSNGVTVLNAGQSVRLGVQNCTFKRLRGTTTPCYGIYFNGSTSTTFLTVTGSTFDGLTSVSTHTCVGVYIVHNDSTDAVVTGNNFNSMNTASGGCHAVEGTGSALLKICATGNVINSVGSSVATSRGFTFAAVDQSSICGNSMSNLSGVGVLYGIAITDAQDSQIVGNSVEEGIAVGQGSYLTIANNVVKVTSSTYGISYTWTSAEAGVQITNNSISCNTNVTAGIYLNGSVGVNARAVSVSGNTITGLTATTGILVAEGMTSGLVIRGNSIVETTFNADNAGIHALSTSVTGHDGVIICDNAVIGVSAGGAARSANKYGIWINSAYGFNVSNNICLWNHSATGQTIRVGTTTVTDLTCGAVNGNAVAPDAAGNLEIFVNATEVICAGNVVSSSSASGTIEANSSAYAGPATIGTNGTFGYNHI